MAHAERFESAPPEPCPSLRVVFGGMNGRFTTTPLQAVARCHGLVAVLESDPRPIRRGLLLDWARAGAGHGNLERFAAYHGAEHLRVGRRAGPELGAWLRRLEPDLLCLSNFSFLLPEEVLGIPRLGTVNLHLSLLPRHRGPNPWLWMFHDGDPTGGATVHRVDAGEDTGPILDSFEHEVPPGITGSELADLVLPRAGLLLAEVVDRLARGDLEERPQGPAEGLRRARFVPPGESLIDWETWSAERVWRFLRGASTWHEPFPPVPGFRRDYAECLPGDPGGPPGTLRQGLRGGWIACRDGRVTFRLEPEPRELLRLALPLVLGAALWALA